jgi:SAM-dependent methyltransferase
MVDYDAFAEIYDVWVSRAPICDRNRPFYVEEYLRTEGPVVELGIGNGRIAIEAARQGKPILGVDSSSVMLAQCRERAAAAGVTDRITLIEADFRHFTLPEPAALITIPFHTIGHLVTLDDKRAVLRRIHEQLRPGGRFVFDHFVFDPESARAWQSPRLESEFVDSDAGRDVLLWAYVRYNHEAQTMRMLSWTDELDAEGVVVRRKYRRLWHSWLLPEQSRALLAEAGFAIEAAYGDFDRSPLAEDSPTQIWIARRV